MVKVDEYKSCNIDLVFLKYLFFLKFSFKWLYFLRFIIIGLNLFFVFKNLLIVVCFIKENLR